jgi:cytochrome c oxidase assembly protein subunit 11
VALRYDDGLTCRLAAQTEAAKAQSNKQGYYLFALIVGMVGVTYASVPLYRMFCQVSA